MAELTTEQKRQFIQNLKGVTVTGGGAALLDRGKVEGNPNYAYKWVNAHEQWQESQQALGWTKVNHKEDKALKVASENFKRSNGEVVRGDTILYYIPKDFATALGYQAEISAVEAVEQRRTDLSTFAKASGLTLKTESI